MALSDIDSYGLEFQKRLFAILLTDKNLFLKTKKILNGEVIRNIGFKLLKSLMDDYYDKYGEIPSLSELKIEIEKSVDEKAKTLAGNLLNDINEIRELKPYQLRFVRDEILEFCKEKKIEKVVYEAAEILDEKSPKKYDKIVKLFKSIETFNEDEPIDALSNIEKYLKESNRVPIKTPWKKINILLGGGIAKGELFIIAAPPGAGKSHFLINMGTGMLLDEKNVLHVTLELSDVYTAKRYYSCVTGISVNEIGNVGIDELKKRLPEKKGKLIISWHPTKSLSVWDLQALYDSAAIEGKKADAIIVDYGDLLRSEREYSESWRGQEEIYYALRSLAGKTGTPVITAAQIGRTGIKDEFIESDKLYGNFSKVMVADVVLTLSRTTTDKATGMVKMMLIKNRFGKDGERFNGSIDTETSRFDFDNIVAPNISTFRRIDSFNPDEIEMTNKEKLNDIF